MLKLFVMPAKISVILLMLVNSISCNQNRKKDIPKILENKKTSIDAGSKRGKEDIVDGLYNEAVNENEALKKLDDAIKELNKSKNDSLDAFGIFDGQNKLYYSTASTHAEEIGDSILKSNIKALIAHSLAKYNAATGMHDSLLKVIALKEGVLKDLQKALKIAYTLPMIEKYQEDNVVPPVSIEGFSQKQAGIVNLADTLVKTKFADTLVQK